MQPVIAILSDDPSHPSIEWIEHQSSFVFDCFPGTPIVAIVRSEKLHAVAVASNRLGLQGYIPTSTPPAVAAAAMHLIIAGGTYFPLVISDGESVTRGGASATKCDRLPANTLSDRERAVAELVGRGMQNKLIAYELNISLSTVKAHVHRISRKLNVRNRTELAVHITTPNEAHVFEGGLQSISIVP
jgi:DNA-binding NarL/FixJ family response regulator